MVPKEHWSDLEKMNLSKVCTNSGAKLDDSRGLLIQFLQDDLQIDIKKRSIFRIAENSREKIDNPLLELMTVVYLLNATADPLSEEMIGVNELKDAHFFQGPHALNVSPLLACFGNNLAAFNTAAEKLGGAPIGLADAAYTLLPFPKIPLYYLLWTGDAEFSAHLSILFDRTIEQHLSADAIWGLVHLVSDALCGRHGLP